jgi:hypothetical protein
MGPVALGLKSQQQGAEGACVVLFGMSATGIAGSRRTERKWKPLRDGSVHGCPQGGGLGGGHGDLEWKKADTGHRTQGKKHRLGPESSTRKDTAPPCRSSTLLHAVQVSQVVETYKDPAAPAVEGHSLSGEDGTRMGDDGMRQNRLASLFCGESSVVGRQPLLLGAESLFVG